MRTFIRQKGYDKTASYAGLAAGASVTLIDEKLPPGSGFQLTHFGNSSFDASGLIAGWGYVSWVVYRNGMPVADLDNIKDQLGTPDQLRKFAVDYLWAPGDQFTIKAFNAAGAPAAYNVGVSVQGAFGYQR